MRSLTLAVLGALVLAACAQASLPKPPSHLIVPGKSIGGVKPGMTMETVIKKWGKGSSCDADGVLDYGCKWEGTTAQGFIQVSANQGKVTSIDIEVGKKPNGYPNYKDKTLKKLFYTANGVTIGTPIAEVAQKYKRAESDGNGVSFVKHGLRTGFGSSLGKAYSIYIQLASFS